MKTVLYLNSTLRRSGPTRQLFNLIKYLDPCHFKSYILTLSPEPQDSCREMFIDLGVNIETLGLSRVGGLFSAKRRVEEKIAQLRPSLIHSQGARADMLMSAIKTDIPWVLTSRTDPFSFYPSKFGKIQGRLLAGKHVASMKNCPNVFACSKANSSILRNYGVDSFVIQNGTQLQINISGPSKVDLNTLPRPIFIHAGSFVPLKNLSFLVDAFKKYVSSHSGSLLLLGDGPEQTRLKAISCDNIVFCGQVDNVGDYLKQADFFVSTSLSEGLPNSVLEALAAGVSVILSDIPPHREIAEMCPRASKLFPLSIGRGGLSEILSNANDLFDSEAGKEAVFAVKKYFSAEVMSQKYQDKYLEILGSQ